MAKKAIKVQMRKEITRNKMKKKLPADNFVAGIDRLNTCSKLDYDTCKNQLGWNSDYDHKRY